MQSFPLSANANQEIYKKIAKDLLKAWKSNEVVVIPWNGSMIAVDREHFVAKNPRFRSDRPVCLADVQFLIARECGFATWSAFMSAVAKSDTEVAPVKALEASHPVAQALTDAIRSGATEQLRELLNSDPRLAKAGIADPKTHGMTRSLLHVATDWPANFPNIAETIRIIVESGGDPNSRFEGGNHRETPLHWAASSGDLAALDALVESGADIEADGAVIANSTALADAVAFAQWDAARRLVELGARTNLEHEAALGLIESVRDRFGSDDSIDQQSVNRAFWFACHGGQPETAEYLLECGADPNWIPPWENLTPRRAALRSGFTDLAEWIGTLS